MRRASTMTRAPSAPWDRSCHMKPNRSCPGVPNRYSLRPSSMVMQPKSSATVVDVFAGIWPARSTPTATEVMAASVLNGRTAAQRIASSPRITLSIRFESCENWKLGRSTTRYPSAARSATSTRATPMCSLSRAATSATDIVVAHSSTMSRCSNDRCACSVTPRSVTRTCASISNVWSTGSARPEVSRYGRSDGRVFASGVPAGSSRSPRTARYGLVSLSGGSSTPSGSSNITSASDGQLQFLDEAGSEHRGGTVGEDRHLVRDRAQARLLGRQHTQRTAHADGAHEQVSLGQLDHHLVGLAEWAAFRYAVREAERRGTDRRQTVRVGPLQPG